MLRITVAVSLLLSGHTILPAEALTSEERSGIVSHVAPAGEALNEDYLLTVNGQTIPVYACRVSAVPFNQVWPGYQRPLDQTELAGFAYWDMDGPVQIAVQLGRAARAAVVRPASLGVQPRIEGRQIFFSLERPHPVVVEVDGPYHALHLFPSPPEVNALDSAAPGVHYFGPGVHRPGRIDVQSDETVYLAAGAVVYGSIHVAAPRTYALPGAGYWMSPRSNEARAAERSGSPTART